MLRNPDITYKNMKPHSSACGVNTRAMQSDRYLRIGPVAKRLDMNVCIVLHTTLSTPFSETYFRCRQYPIHFKWVSSLPQKARCTIASHLTSIPGENLSGYGFVPPTLIKFPSSHQYSQPGPQDYVVNKCGVAVSVYHTQSKVFSSVY